MDVLSAVGIASFVVQMSTAVVKILKEQHTDRVGWLGDVSDPRIVVAELQRAKPQLEKLQKMKSLDQIERWSAEIEELQARIEQLQAQYEDTIKFYKIDTGGTNRGYAWSGELRDKLVGLKQTGRLGDSVSNQGTTQLFGLYARSKSHEPPDYESIEPKLWALDTGVRSRSLAKAFRIASTIAIPQLLLSTSTFSGRYRDSWSSLGQVNQLEISNRLKPQLERDDLEALAMQDVFRPLSQLQSVLTSSTNARVEVSDPLVFALLVAGTSMILATHWQLNKQDAAQRWLMATGLLTICILALAPGSNAVDALFCVFPRVVFLALGIGGIHRSIVELRGRKSV